MLINPVLFLILIVMSSIAYITSDMYLPSMPAITISLHSKPDLIQFTLSIYLFGFGVSQLFYGPLSDWIGRRKPILFGLGLTMIGGVICCAAYSIKLLWLGRFLQGCGIGATTSVGRSITRDLLSGPYLAKLGSFMGMIMVFVTATAPIIGGYIQTYYSWRMNFFVILLLTFLVWIFVWKTLPETNQHIKREAININHIVNNYIFLLKNKTFLGFTLCMSCAYAGILAYLTVAPFIFQNILGLSPIQFGWLAFIVGGSIFISAFINSQMVLKKGIPKMMLIGIFLMFVAGLLMLIFGWCKCMNTFAILFPIALFIMGAGFTTSNSFAGAFHPFPHMAGSAGALFGCIQILTASFVSTLMALFPESNQMPLAWTLFSLAILSFFSFKFLAVVEYEKNKTALIPVQSQPSFKFRSSQKKHETDSI